MSVCGHGIFTIYECKPNSPVQCVECSEPFLDIHLLEEHICEVHLDSWVPYRCVVCQPQQHFTTELVLKTHLRYIHGIKKPIITFLSSEDKREKLHHLLVRSLIRSGTSHPAIQSRWQAEPPTQLVQMPRVRQRPSSSYEPMVPSSSSAVFAAEPMSSTRFLAPSPQQGAKFMDNKAKMLPFSSNITTYVPGGFKTATVDTTYRIGPRPMSRESPVTVSRSRAKTASPPPSNRNPHERSLDEQLMVLSNRSRERDDNAVLHQRSKSVRSRRDRSEAQALQRHLINDNRAMIEKFEFPQSWNETPRYDSAISLDNLRLRLKTDSETMKNLCYRITVMEDRIQTGEATRYDQGPSSTPV